MSIKDPLGMQKPAQEFKTMIEIRQERADKAERQRDQLAEALQDLLDDAESMWNTIDGEYGPLGEGFGDLDGQVERGKEPAIAKARAALQQLESNQ